MTTLAEKDKNMGEEFARFNKEVRESTYQFDRQEKECALLKTITKEEFQHFFDCMFNSGSKRVDIRYNSKAHKEMEEACEFKNGGCAEKCYDSLASFKAAMDSYPDEAKTRFVSHGQKL